MERRITAIIITGPSGSGKSTLADQLAERNRRYYAADFGRLARKRISEGRLEEEIVSSMEKGLPLPTHLNYYLIKDCIDELINTGKFDPKHQILISGGNFGTAENARMLKKILDIKGIIVLDADDTTLQQRLKEQVNKDKRNDYSPKVVGKRLSTFRKNIGMVLDEFYDDRLLRVNASLPVKEVCNKVEKQINDFLKYEDEISYEIITSEEELTNLKEIWNMILSSSRLQKPSMSFEWNYYWWNNYQNKGKLHIAIVKRNNKIVGIMPLKKNNGTISFIPDCTADFSDFVCSKPSEDHLTYLLSELTQEQDSFVLKNIPFDKNRFEIYKSFFHADEYTYSFDKIIEVTIEGNWEQYLASKSKNFRNNLSKKNSKMKRSGAIELKVVSPPAKEDFEEIKKLHINRYEGTSTPSKYLRKDRVGFILNLFSNAEFFNPVMFKLYVGSLCMGFRFGYVMAGVYYDWNTACRMDLGANESPGLVLLGLIMKKFFDEGIISSYNFMRGEEPYKEEWGNAASANFNIIKK